MIDRKQLLADLRGEVVRLEGDLREQVGAVEGLERQLRDEHAAARKARRTSATWTSWRDEQVTQAAVAWVLGTVFVRWCEDNELIDAMLSGPGERLGVAEDAQLAYFRAHPHRTDADLAVLRVRRARRQRRRGDAVRRPAQPRLPDPGLA